MRHFVINLQEDGDTLVYTLIIHTTDESKVEDLATEYLARKGWVTDQEKKMFTRIVEVKGGKEGVTYVSALS